MFFFLFFWILFWRVGSWKFWAFLSSFWSHHITSIYKILNVSFFLQIRFSGIGLVLLMAEILHQLIGSLSHLQGFMQDFSHQQYDCNLICDLVGCSSDHCHWHGTEHLCGHWRRSLQWPWDLEMPHAESAWDLFSHFFVPFEVGKFDLLDGMFFFSFFPAFFSHFLIHLFWFSQKNRFIDPQIFIRFFWALALFFTGHEVGFEAPISLIAWKSLPPTLRQKAPCFFGWTAWDEASICL